MPEDTTAKSANLVWALLSQNDISPPPRLVAFRSVSPLGHPDMNLIPASDNHLLHTCVVVLVKYPSEWKAAEFKAPLFRIFYFYPLIF